MDFNDEDVRAYYRQKGGTKQTEVTLDLKTSPSLQLVVACLIVYAIEAILSANPFTISNGVIALVAFGIPTLSPATSYTFFISIVAHANLAHVGGNVLFLLIYGLRLEEQELETHVYISFFVSALVANLASIIAFHDTISLGASAGVFGILGMNLMLNYSKPHSSGKGLFFSGFVFLIFSGTSANVNFVAHFVGFGVGLALGRYFYFYKDQNKTDAQNDLY